MTQALLEKENTAIFEDDAAQFLQEIRRYPLLTPEEELEVAKACAQGNQAAIRRMVNSKKITENLAESYQYTGNDGENGTPILIESAVTAASRAEGLSAGSGPHQPRRQQRRRAPALRA